MGISRQDALDCFSSDDLIGIGMEADAVRRNLHPEGVVSYAIDGAIDHADPDILNKIQEIADTGGTSITLQGEVRPDQTIATFEALLTAIIKRYPSIWLHSLSATEILTLARQSGLSIEDTLRRLQASGLGSIPGNDAGILDDAVHHQGPRSRWKTADWIAVHRTAHALGMQTTATMIFGGGETFEHRINHLETIHRLQEETGGFASFTPSSFEQQTPARGFEEATAVEYLKTLAISRMLLHNIENIQSDLKTQGLKVLQVGLRFGANDAGSVLPPGSGNAATEEQLRQVIRDAGFKPVQRDALYRTMLLSE